MSAVTMAADSGGPLPQRNAGRESPLSIHHLVELSRPLIELTSQVQLNHFLFTRNRCEAHLLTPRMPNMQLRESAPQRWVTH